MLQQHRCTLTICINVLEQLSHIAAALMFFVFESRGQGLLFFLLSEILVQAAGCQHIKAKEWKESYKEGPSFADLLSSCSTLFNMKLTGPPCG